MEKQGVKIVTIGGGSSYTPELMEGFIKRYKELPIREIWLVDVEGGKEKLEIVGALAQRMWDATPYDVKVHLTLDRREALPGADFVTTQLRVGLLNARIKDERIPLSHGQLGQETNGAGGMMKALRTVPVVLEIVEDMKELCPDAWLINFANPSGIVTEAVLRYGNWKKVVGLCNVPINLMIKEPAMFDKTGDDYVFQFAGLNHFHYHRVFAAEDGRELTKEFIDRIFEVEDDGTPANIHKEKFLEDQLKSMNCIPCGYLRYYYMYGDMLKFELGQFEKHETRAELVRQTEKELFELYKNQELHEKPELLSKRGGTYYSDAACECINAIYNNKGTVMVVSTENRGAVSDLPEGCAVEVSSRMTAKGPMPLAWGSFEPSERGWLQVMKATEECIIKAAVDGDYGQAIQAFQMNPIINAGRGAKALLDEMLVANKKFLPRFKAKIEELEAAGVAPQDSVVKELCEKGL